MINREIVNEKLNFKLSMPKKILIHTPEVSTSVQPNTQAKKAFNITYIEVGVELGMAPEVETQKKFSEAVTVTL